MPLAQVSEVAEGGGAAEGVVDLAPDRRPPASREPAMLIPRPQEPALRPSGTVRVDRDHRPTHRVRQQPRQRRGLCGKTPSRVGIDRRTPHQIRGTLLRTHQRERRDDHLHLRANRTQRPGLVTGRSRIEGGRPGEEQVGEHVGADRVDPALIPVFRVAGVDHGLCLLGEAVEDPVADHRRDGRDHVAHPIPSRKHPHAPGRGGVLVTFGERAVGESFREELQDRAEPVRGAPLTLDDRFSLELGPTMSGDDVTGIRDDLNLALRDPA
ncbi:hypothetical protein, partial [Microbacterium telephonicum]|uniref:hypothetical protein n=1 Tax=Microbacterium telephonicum TaxID=1714841 RepID=UPI003BB1D2C8